jgi:hypothetical protein
MPYSWRIAQLLWKEETNEGTAVTPGNDDCNIQVLVDPDIDMDIPFQPRNVVSALAGTFAGAAGGLKIGRFRFRVAMNGSGTAGTAPVWGKILQNGGFVETDTLSDDAYAYSASAWSTTKTATCILNSNGLEHKIHGARAKSIRIVVPVGEAPIMEVEAWGAYNAPAAVALSTATYQSGGWPAYAGTTGTFTYDSTAMEISSLEINIENECEPRPKPGLDSNVFSIHGAPGTVTGSIDPITEAPGTYNFFTKYIANTEAVMTAVIGGTAGSILTISGPKVQMTGVKHERRGHTAIYRCGLAFNRSSGNDCLTLTTT